MTPAIDRVLDRVEPIPFSGCWIFMGALNKAGYGVVGTGGRGSPNDRAHRIVYRHYRGEIPRGMYVCHSCDVRACCNPAHLFLGTPRDNRQDCKRKGRDTKPPRNEHLKAEVHYAASFTNQQVRAIRTLLRCGMTQTALARDFGVSRDCIGKIHRGERWKSV